MNTIIIFAASIFFEYNENASQLNTIKTEAPPFYPSTYAPLCAVNQSESLSSQSNISKLQLNI